MTSQTFDVFAVLVDAPADPDFFETLNGFPVTIGLVAFGSENDFLEFLGHFEILFAQLFATGQLRADGRAILFGIKVVGIATASAETERFAFVPTFVKRPAKN